MSTVNNNAESQAAMCESFACRFFVYLAVAVVVLVTTASFIYLWVKFFCCRTTQRNRIHAEHDIPELPESRINTISSSDDSQNEQSDEHILWLASDNSNKQHALYEAGPSVSDPPPAYPSPLLPKPMHSQYRPQKWYLETPITFPNPIEYAYPPHQNPF
ncbi:hypothetical protein BX667DRAFT_56977 [Coemansia mojavensis]|nr:hypothetical protein BX667DRAFT_56977 [Coemansia mojavensis]